MSKKKSNETRIELTYACHRAKDPRFICGRGLAEQLVEDALKLLVPIHGGDLDAVWNDLWQIAAPVARKLDDEVKAGGSPGLVLRVGPRDQGSTSS